MHRSSLRVESCVRTRQARTFDFDANVIDRRHVDPAADRASLIAGLRAPSSSISPKYLYDAEGCALFVRICQLPEYYPTRTEARIFASNRLAIVAAAGIGKQLVDLGAGDCAKAGAWLPWLKPSAYVAIDIADDALADALPRLASSHPGIDVRGILTDFTRGFDVADDVGDGPTTYFYPGSSIGNFAPAAALTFLSRIRRHCGPDGESGLLIGVDTKKDIARLKAAYDDAAGVTAAFNRNVLVHVNRILGADFDPRRFRHVSVYNGPQSRVEMHLEALETHTVSIAGSPRTYERGERIHTESSYKYAPAEFSAMLQRVGFSDIRCWQDGASDFAVYYAT